MNYSEWKLTDQEMEECRDKGLSINGAQLAKKQAYIEAGGIILNPNALPDLYEALKDLLWDLKQGAVPNDLTFIEEALAKAEGK